MEKSEYKNSMIFKNRKSQDLAFYDDFDLSAE